MKFCLEIGSLVFITILLILWVTPKKLGLYSESVFYSILFSSFIAISANVATVVIAKFSLEIDSVLFSILEILYFACLAIFLYYELLYVLANIMSSKEAEKISFPLAALPLIECILVILTPSKIVIREGELVYTSLSYNFLFAFLVVTILVKTIFVIMNFRKLEFHKRNLIIVIAVVYMLGFVLDYVFNLHGIFDLFIVIGIDLLLCYFDNPYSNINKDYKCFKQSTITPYLEEQFESKTPLFVVAIGFGYLLTDDSIEKELKVLRKNIVKEFATVPEVKVFVNSNNDIYAFSEEIKLLDDFLMDTQEILEDFRNNLSNANSIRSCIVYCRDSLYVTDAQSLIRHLCIAIDNTLAMSTSLKPLEITKEMIESVAKEEEIKNTVLWALENDRFEVFYQPIYSASLSRFTSAEALARIRKEDGTILMPGKFIRVAEKKGLVEKIGDKIYEKVCEFIADYVSKEKMVDYISVNLSSQQIQNQNLADQYIEIAKKYMIEPQMVSFEISENDISSAKEIAMNNINKFREFGFRLALDGFGKNESNLNSFVDYPVDTIKLNMRLVWEYFEKTDIQTLVRAIIKIAHNLKLEVVAEGVETLPQLDIMVKEKADYIQGYYFFKPMSVNDYIDFLRPTIFSQDTIVQSSLQKADSE